MVFSREQWYGSMGAVFVAAASLVSVPFPLYAAEEGISVHLAPYVLGHIGGLPITATLVTAWLTMLLLIATAYVVGRRMTLIPGNMQSVFELLIGGA